MNIIWFVVWLKQRVISRNNFFSLIIIIHCDFKIAQLAQNHLPGGGVFILRQSIWNHLIKQARLSQNIIAPNETRLQIHHWWIDGVVSIVYKRTERWLGTGVDFGTGHILRRFWIFFGRICLGKSNVSVTPTNWSARDNARVTATNK